MNSIVELTAFRGQPVWEFLAAQYLFMIQTGAWALLAGCAAWAWGGSRYHSLRVWGILAGTGLALAAPLNLVAELLSPWRFVTMLYRFSPASPLSWGVVAISAVSLLGLLSCAAVFRQDIPFGKKLAGVTALAALGVIVYTWADLGLAAGVPLWRQPGASLVLACSGLASGLALCLGLASMTGGSASDALLLRLLTALASGISGMALFLWGGLAEWPPLTGWPLGAVLLTASALSLIAASPLFLRKNGAGLRAACLLTLAASLCLRLGVVLMGQAAALGIDQGEPHLLGHAGLGIALAPGALWLFLMFCASIALRRKPEPTAVMEANA